MDGFSFSHSLTHTCSIAILKAFISLFVLRHQLWSWNSNLVVPSVFLKFTNRVKCYFQFNKIFKVTIYKLDLNVDIRHVEFKHTE